MKSVDKKPEITLIVDGEDTQLDFLIGTYRQTGEPNETSETVIVGEMDINDLLNAVAFTIRQVFTAAAHHVGADEARSALMLAITDGIKETFEKDGEEE